MRHVLRKGDAVSASTVVRATPDAVYDVVSDVQRIPSWSPECVQSEWVSDTAFRGVNRRRFGRWTTMAHVVVAERGREFTFIVRLQNADFTKWSYQLEQHPQGCRLTEKFEMCVDLPLLALAFERIALGVRDRRTDLQGNIDQSLRRIRALVESEHGQRTHDDNAGAAQS